MRPLIIKEGKMLCPVCSGMMHDNRTSKKNPKAPDYRCKDPECKWQLNPQTGEYETSTFVTGVWLKKELDQSNKELTKSVKKNGYDEVVEGKKENTALMCSTQIMSALIKTYGVGTTTITLKIMHRDLWSEINQ